MTPVYAVLLAVGAISILAWVAMVAVAESVDGWAHVDPDRRFGERGRMAVGGVTGFGIAGLSASFGGWETLPALGAAVASGAAIAWAAAALGSGPADDA